MRYNKQPMIIGAVAATIGLAAEGDSARHTPAEPFH
jgi:hypothetical protein